MIKLILRILLNTAGSLDTGNLPACLTAATAALQTTCAPPCGATEITRPSGARVKANLQVFLASSLCL